MVAGNPWVTEDDRRFDAIVDYESFPAWQSAVISTARPARKIDQPSIEVAPNSNTSVI